jgi:hypothetical protein
MIVEKIPFINKLSRDNVILLGGLIILTMGIIILIVGGLFAPGTAIIMLAAGVACLIYLLIPSMQEPIRKYLPAAAGGLGSIIGIVTFINTFYLYQFIVGSPLLGQVIILISIAASLLVFDAGLSILGIGIPKEKPGSSSAGVSESKPSENE